MTTIITTMPTALPARRSITAAALRACMLPA
jgi:hypothetical protein